MSKVAGILGIAAAVLGGIAAIIEAVANSRDDIDGYSCEPNNYPILDDGVDWYCDCCGAYLNTQPEFSTITEMWICTECGCINDVSENNIIQESEMDYRLDDNYVPLRKEKEYRGYIPAGCRACGGPYPDCMTSCNLFDD